MTPRQRDEARRALERIEAEIVGAGAVPIEPNRTDEASVGVSDEDAQALSEMMQSIASSRNREQAARLGRVRRALEKLAARPEEYGLCEECEEEIGASRLALLPEVALCTECQAAQDPRRGGRRRLGEFR